MTQSPLPGNDRVLNELLEDPDPLELLRVTLLMRPATPLDEGELMAQGSLPPVLRTPRTAAQLAEAHSAIPEDLRKVEAFAGSLGFQVVEVEAARRKVVLEGKAEIVAAAFGLTFGSAMVNGQRHRVATGELRLPPELEGRVTAILGLDARPHMKPHLRHHPFGEVDHHASGGVSPIQLANLYGFPPFTGEGQRVALIELGGGYTEADIKGFFEGLDLPLPRIRNVYVDGAGNNPIPATDLFGPPTPERMEVTLDLQVLGAVAPKAEIAVVFAPNTDQGFINALHAALHDTEGTPHVISISWGSVEKKWHERILRLFSEELKMAAAMGVTVLASSGDAGSRDGETDGRTHVNFPASSPWVLACGGTTLTAKDGKPEERVWNATQPIPGATGGGVSDRFDLPPYQQAAGVPPSVNDQTVGRGVPDVAANADMTTGYRIFLDGKWAVLGGTSAAAPLWAGLIARCNEALGAPCGFLHPLLYAHPEAFRPISEGDNPDYHATGAYSACTGLGTPDGGELLKVLSPRNL